VRVIADVRHLMSRQRSLLCFASCVLLLASCASPSRQFPAVTPGQSFEGGFINVRAPNSEGWRLVDSSTRGMAFGKPGLAAGENLSAQVLMFDLRPTETADQFVQLIKEGIQKDTDPTRFDAVDSSTVYTNEREYPCVRYHGVFNDKEARTSPTTKEQLVLETYSLYCRYPARTSSGFAAIYSYRGRSRYPALDKEAEDFIKGVQVPSAKVLKKPASKDA
jgi:hypothetical protein